MYGSRRVKVSFLSLDTRNRFCFEIIFKLRQSSLFLSAYRYMRLCDSYALNFFRSPEKVSGNSILGKVFFVRIVGIAITVMIVLSVGLAARFLLLLVDIVAHSVTCTR
jgi:hypothetical protein